MHLLVPAYLSFLISIEIYLTYQEKREKEKLEKVQKMEALSRLTKSWKQPRCSTIFDHLLGMHVQHRNKALFLTSI